MFLQSFNENARYDTMPGNSCTGVVVKRWVTARRIIGEAIEHGKGRMYGGKLF